MAKQKPARIDIGEVTLVWGEAAACKSELRQESERRHAEKPIAERLRAALALVLPRSQRDEDLLIHKMIKLRHDRRRLLQDLADVRAVLGARGESFDWPYVRTWLRPEEASLLEAVSSADDAELIRRLLGG